VTPTSEQQAAIATIEASLRDRRFEAFLLFGVTGSGKTEVYLRAIETALALGRTALYLVPEIGLTPLLARRMQSRFGDVLALLHSGLTEGERADEWRRVQEGRVKVVLGARSAIFAPLRDAGLLIVDEEHDASYKQEEHPRYSGRDLAVVRGQRLDAAVILGSATPSMESYHNALRKKYTLLTLTRRVAGAVLPLVHRVDMRREFEETGAAAPLSRRLLTALRERLERGEQSLILLNRRGFSTFVLCRACGQTLECGRCSIALTLHLRERRLRCHYCQDSRPVPASCPECGSGHLHFGGTGTEKLEETVRSLLPKARLARMDRDTVRGRGAIEDLLDRVERGEVDILLGTQMIAKGHDFPNVTLVGVLTADALLGLPDFRAGERTFQLLAQMAGRSGRRERPGEVIVQAYDPDHHAVRSACEHDFEAFARAELVYRRTLQYPPFSALAMLVFRDGTYERAWERASVVAAGLRRSRPEDLQVLGPAPAPLEKLRGRYRVQVLLKGARRASVRRGLEEAAGLLERLGVRNDSVTVDVDPASTL
jgi:primosomal protein N' (replication factor Y)